MQLKVVHARVDAWVFAFRVELEPDLLAELERAAQLKCGDHHGSAAVEWGPLVGELTYAGDGKFIVANARYKVVIVPGASGGERQPDGTRQAGWTVKLEWYAQGSADLRPSTVYRVTREFAEGLGLVYAAATRRIDFCSDVAGYELDKDDAEKFVRPSWSAGLSEHAFADSVDSNGNSLGEALGKEAPETHAPSKTVRHWLSKITGFTVCPGGTVMARIYDKVTHCKLLKEDTRAKEEERWREGGWDGESPVTRVEFQLRGECLKEFGVRNPDRLFDPETHRVFASWDDVVDRMWRACLGWLSLRNLDHKRAARRTLDPRWAVLATARFVREADAPHARKRVRSGATVEQAFGSDLSVLGADGELDRLDVNPPLDEDEAAVRLRLVIADVMARAGVTFAGHFEKKWGGAIGALRHVAIVNNAKRAKFIDVLAKTQPPARAAPVAA